MDGEADGLGEQWAGEDRARAGTGHRVEATQLGVGAKAAGGRVDGIELALARRPAPPGPRGRRGAARRWCRGRPTSPCCQRRRRPRPMSAASRAAGHRRRRCRRGGRSGLGRGGGGGGRHLRCRGGGGGRHLRRGGGGRGGRLRRWAQRRAPVVAGVVGPAVPGFGAGASRRCRRAGRRRGRDRPPLVAGEGVGGDIREETGGGDGTADQHPVDDPQTAKPAIAAGVRRRSEGAAHDHDSVQIRLSGIYPSMRTLFTRFAGGKDSYDGARGEHRPDRGRARNRGFHRPWSQRPWVRGPIGARRRERLRARAR